tara:strand:+ start:1002 stop:2216 length:1215 start_codon:yes stop_codon:yes gene_type:complete
MTQKCPVSIEQEFEKFSSYSMTPAEAHDLIERARNKCPVPHSNELGGFHIFMNYEDVRNGLMDWQTYASSPSVLRPYQDDMPVFPPNSFDPPEHTHWRKIFTNGVNVRTPDRIEPLVRADTVELIEKFVERGECDLHLDLAEFVPMKAIFHVLGLEPELHETLRHMNMDLLAAVGDPKRFKELWAPFSEFGWKEVEKRKSNPGDDYLSVLANAELDGRPLTPEEVGACVISLLTAGHGTTIAALTNLFYEVLRRPELKQRLIDNPADIPLAVNEGLRLHHPFLGLFRRTTTDVEIHGKTIKQGESVYMAWEAANRDPAVTENPLEFDIDRPDFQHLAFGLGKHSCVGRMTALMEMRVVMEELLSRVPDIELVAPDKVVWEFHGAETQGFLELPARFTPRNRRES